MIESLVEQSAKLPLAEVQVLAQIEARHADLHHTVLNFWARSHEPRREVIDTLEIDFADLVISVDKWKARQAALQEPLTAARSIGTNASVQSHLEPIQPN